MIDEKKLIGSSHLLFSAQYFLEYYDKYFMGSVKDIPDDENAAREDAHIKLIHQELRENGIFYGTDSLKADMEELRRILRAE
jgi:hypothetical protein